MKIDDLMAELVEVTRRAWYPRLAFELMSGGPLVPQPLWYWDVELPDDDELF